MPCRTSGHDSIPEEDFAQNEMDLGELGGDELNVQQDEEDGDDDGAFDKQPKKQQRCAIERNIVLQTIVGGC
jgi:hypothetical protein